MKLGCQESYCRVDARLDTWFLDIIANSLHISATKMDYSANLP